MKFKVRCPDCGKVRLFEPRCMDKETWRAMCFVCGRSYKVER